MFSRLGVRREWQQSRKTGGGRGSYGLAGVAFDLGGSVGQAIAGIAVRRIQT